MTGADGGTTEEPLEFKWISCAILLGFMEVFMAWNIFCFLFNILMAISMQ